MTLAIPVAGQSAQQAIDDGRNPVVPTGVYDLKLIEAKRAKKENDAIAAGQQPETFSVDFCFEITAGDFMGTRIWETMRFVWPNSAQAMRIAKARYGELCKACGQADMPADPNVFAGFEMSAKVALKPANGQYGPSNGINEIAAKGSLANPAAPSPTAPPPMTQAPAPQQQAPAPQQQAPAPSTTAPPPSPAPAPGGMPFGTAQPNAASQPFNQ